MSYWAYVVVDSQRATLGVLPAMTVRNSLWDSLQSYRQENDISTASMVRKHTLANGDTVDELFTEKSLMALHNNGLAPLARVDVFHAKQLAVLAHLEPGHVYDSDAYGYQGSLVVNEADALNEAYYYSQNLDYAWNPGRRSRSSSVGDIFKIGDRAVMVTDFGFVAIEFKEFGPMPFGLIDSQMSP